MQILHKSLQEIKTLRDYTDIKQGKRWGKQMIPSFALIAITLTFGSDVTAETANYALTKLFTALRDKAANNGWRYWLILWPCNRNPRTGESVRLHYHGTLLAIPGWTVANWIHDYWGKRNGHVCNKTIHDLPGWEDNYILKQTSGSPRQQSNMRIESRKAALALADVSATTNNNCVLDSPACRCSLDSADIPGDDNTVYSNEDLTLEKYTHEDHLASGDDIQAIDQPAKLDCNIFQIANNTKSMFLVVDWLKNQRGGQLHEHNYLDPHHNRVVGNIHCLNINSSIVQLVTPARAGPSRAAPGSVAPAA